MKILLLGDIHQHHDNINKVKEFYKKCPDADIIIHVGDWISSYQGEFKLAIELLRDRWPKTPVSTVLGNHDFWDNQPTTLNDRLINIQKLFTEYNINYLEKKSSKEVCGFDGWYNYSNPPTNDLIHLNPNTYAHFELRNSASKGLNRVLGSNAKICVTHFPSIETPEFPGDWSMLADPKHLEPLTEKFDLLLVGHTHRHMDVVVNGCRIVNNGCDYDKKKYYLINEVK